jgi:hypothetical protein
MSGDALPWQYSAGFAPQRLRGPSATTTSGTAFLNWIVTLRADIAVARKAADAATISTSVTVKSAIGTMSLALRAKRRR